MEAGLECPKVDGEVHVLLHVGIRTELQTAGLFDLTRRPTHDNHRGTLRGGELAELHEERMAIGVGQPQIEEDQLWRGREGKRQLPAQEGHHLAAAREDPQHQVRSTIRHGSLYEVEIRRTVLHQQHVPGGSILSAHLRLLLSLTLPRALPKASRREPRRPLAATAASRKSSLMHCLSYSAETTHWQFPTPNRSVSPDDSARWREKAAASLPSLLPGVGREQLHLDLLADLEMLGCLWRQPHLQERPLGLD